jgi:carbonic anhydrase
MRSIDFTYRFDPTAAEAVRTIPADAAQARAMLEEGNRLFARWIADCLKPDEGQPASYIVPCGPQDLGLPTPEGLAAKQEPFAVLLGCADARVPAEMLFGQVRNNLFVVRLAGNVLSDEALGSVSYAVHNLATNLRIIVVLGHTGCGAVSAAVDTYLNPWAYLAKVPSAPLRSIVDRIFVPVRKAASALQEVLGPAASGMPGYREALLETAVFVNAAQTAYNLRLEMEVEHRSSIQVFYGVFDLLTHRVWSIPMVKDRPGAENRLAEAPLNLDHFEEVALRMALRVVRGMPSGKS